MIDYKYHVTSLVAIFLALGVGILIGSMALGNDFLGNQQEVLINRLEGDFQQLRVQNGLTRSELAAANDMVEEYKEFCQQLMPALIKDKLQNYRVIVIQTNSSCNLADITDPLKKAGAEVEAVVSVLSDFSLAKVSAALPSPGREEGFSMLDMMGEAILFGDDQGFMADLAKRKLIKISGTTGNSIDAVILAGGSQVDMGEQAKWLDLSLVDFFLKNNLNVIGVEPSTTPYSYMSYYQTKPIGTIDNIDSLPGQVALIYSVLGEKGNFGVKKTAKKLIPDLF